jgi:hypothetical protein
MKIGKTKKRPVTKKDFEIWNDILPKYLRIEIPSPPTEKLSKTYTKDFMIWYNTTLVKLEKQTAKCRESFMK